MWCVGQQEAYAQLRLFSDLLFHRQWQSSFLSPRLLPLIVGPTGVGKSHVVKTLAHDLSLPFLRLTSSNWIVSGSRDLTTATRVQQFVSAHNSGIIQVDELDKFQQSTSDWCRHVTGEVFDLLDGIILHDLDLSKKLRTRMLIIGSGTWQDLWSKTNGGTIGFKAPESHESNEEIRRKIRDSNIIPQLLRRFNSSLIVIRPAEENDYRNSAHTIGLVGLANSLGLPLDYGEAVRSQCGSRWLEEKYTQLLLLAVRNGREDLVPITSSMERLEGFDQEIPF
jgi:SpoVK/Ycf46/Vps4 family AAA+-type ATPase